MSGLVKAGTPFQLTFLEICGLKHGVLYMISRPPSLTQVKFV